MLAGLHLGRNALLGKIYISLSKKILPPFIMYDDQKIFLDSGDAINLAIIDFDYENYELSIFKTEIKPGDVVIDAGANIGIYTLVATKLVGNYGKVYSFEPEPITFDNIKRNVIENACENVILTNKAVSSKTGKAKLSTWSRSKTAKTTNYLSNEENDLEDYVIVETVSLDDFFENKLKKINIVKIDIEGSEFEALKGMKNIIEQNSEIKIFLEFNPFTLNRAGVDIPEFVDYLMGFNFVLNNIDEEKKELQPVDKNWLLEYAENKNDGHYTNLLCIKSNLLK